jgi:hypothetical protein
MTDSTSSPDCPRCGAPANPVVVGGLCPACLLKQVAMGTPADGLSADPWTPPAPSELATVFPHLEIIELIGRGGMGAVYKAHQKSLGRFVALKILNPQHAANPSFAERFSREARAMAGLDHSNIVTVHDFGRAGEFYFLLMEHVAGVNLRQAMNASRFTPEQALAIVPSICDALQFAHDHGIVHCDVKPENLLLDKTGRVKIADFGIARMIGAGLDRDPEVAAPVASNLTQESVLGTPQYMAPEQLEQPEHVDQRADVYSLGVVLYELLTGELPAGRFDPPSRKVQIDVRLDAIVLRALEHTPELRYQTLGEMRTDVETVINESRSAGAVSQADVSAPRPMNFATSFVTTPEQLSTFEGQFFGYRRKCQMLLDDRELRFARAGTTTVIPLAAIRDLSIGHYPRAMNHARIDLISVTYDAGGQTKRLFFSPYESMFGLPSHFNQFVAEWFDAIRTAVKAATGREPANSPADQLGVPSGSLELNAFGLSLWLIVAIGLLLPFAAVRNSSLPWLGPVMICLVGGSLVLRVILKQEPSGDKLSGDKFAVVSFGLTLIMSGAVVFAVLWYMLRIGPPQVTPPPVPPPLFKTVSPRSIAVPPPRTIPGELSGSGYRG